IVRDRVAEAFELLVRGLQLLVAPLERLRGFLAGRDVAEYRGKENALGGGPLRDRYLHREFLAALVPPDQPVCSADHARLPGREKSLELGLVRRVKPLR